MGEIDSKKLLESIKKYVEEGQKPQTEWFKICSVLMGLYCVIVSFIFLEVWNTNKQQDKSIASLRAHVAVNDSRIGQLERVRYEK